MDGARLRALLGPLALLCTLATSSVASADEPPTKTIQRTLPNGLRVLVRRDARTPLVAISTIYQVGTATDPDGQRGMSAVIGKMLPELDTRHLTWADRRHLFEAAGVHWWLPRATWSDDRTAVNVRVPARAFDLALWLEAERMGFMSDGVNNAELSYAKKKVAEDDANLDGEPSSRMSSALELAAFGAQSSYAKPHLPLELDAIDGRSVQQRLRSHYGAGNAYLVVVGDIDPDVALERITRYFGRLPGAPVAEPAATPAPSNSQVTHVPAAPDYELAGLSWPSARFLTQDDLTLDVLARYLRIVLMREIVYGDHTASGAMTRQVSKRRASVFLVGSALEKGHTATEWRAKVEAVLERIRKGDVQAAELEAAKGAIIASIASSNDGLLEVAEDTGVYARTVNDPDYAPRCYEGYRKVSAEMLSDVARRMLTPERAQFVVADLPPMKVGAAPAKPAQSAAVKLVSALPAPQDDAVWYKPPAVLTEARSSMPSLVDDRLSSGQRFLFSRRADAPIVTFRVEVPWKDQQPAVNAYDALRALVYLPVKNQPSLEARLRDIGATVTTQADSESFVATVQVVPDRFEQAALLVDKELHTVRFSKERVDELLEQVRKLEPDTIQAKLGAWESALLFQPGHRYYRPIELEKELAKINVGSLETYWRSQLPYMRFSIVGDLQSGQVREALEKAIKARPAPAKSARQTRYKSPPLSSKRIQLVDDPGAKQIEVLFAFPVNSRYDGDFATAFATRWLLGSDTIAPTLSSQLAKEGLRNNSRVSVTLRQEANQFQVRFTLDKGQLAAATRALLAHAELLGKGEFSFVNVAQAINDADWWLAQQFDSSEELGKLLELLGTNELESTALSKARRNVLSLDKNALQKTAQTYLIPDNLYVVAYGAVADEAAALEKILGTAAVVEKAPETKP